MAWQCAVCYEEEGVDAVCHHCGKPLCDNRKGNEKTCRAVIADSDFAGNSVRAVHCPSCVQQYHPGVSTGLRRATT